MSIEYLKALSQIPAEYQPILQDMPDEVLDRVLDDLDNFVTTCKRQTEFYESMSYEPSEITAMLIVSVTQTYADKPT